MTVGYVLASSTHVSFIPVLLLHFPQLPQLSLLAHTVQITSHLSVGRRAHSQAAGMAQCEVWHHDNVQARLISRRRGTSGTHNQEDLDR